MPSYDICYRNEDGTLAARIAADCANDMQAKVLAHAMKPKGSLRIEVWDEATLVYQRPQPVCETRSAA